MPYKISVDHDACIGCGACAATCDNFKLVDGKSEPVKADVSELSCEKEASESCPVNAIKIEKN